MKQYKCVEGPAPTSPEVISVEDDGWRLVDSTMAGGVWNLLFEKVVPKAPEYRGDN